MFLVNATLFLIDFFTSQRGQWGYCDPNCIQYGQRPEDKTTAMSVIEERTKNSISTTPLDPNIKCAGHNKSKFFLIMNSFFSFK